MRRRILIIGGAFSEAHYWACRYSNAYNTVRLPSRTDLRNAGKYLMHVRDADIYIVGTRSLVGDDELIRSIQGMEAYPHLDIRVFTEADLDRLIKEAPSA